MSRRDPVWLAESIAGRRVGLKGPQAAAALAAAGISVPPRPNSWAPLAAAETDGSWNVVGRLGATEFFLEEAGAAPRIAALEELIARGVAGAWPVLREDRAIVLGGGAADAVLAQTCNVELAAVPGAKTVIMTSMIGVGVLVLPQIDDEDGPVYRIWCDPSYGAYLWDELETMVERITTGERNERR